MKISTWFRNLLVCGTCLMGLSAQSAVLFKDGKPQASIVVQEGSSAPIRRAADEMSRWLKEATGCEWPIGFAPKQGLLPIYIGDSEFARGQGFDKEALKPDGYLLKATDEFLLIVGRDYPGGMMEGPIQPLIEEFCWCPELELNAFGEMGTWNGVERFLEQYLGIRWFMPGYLGTVVPHCSELVVPNVTKTDAPDFEYRHPWFCNFRDSLHDALWYRRVGFGAKAPISINHSYYMMQWCRTSKPEIFAIIDGERDFDRKGVSQGGGNFCLTNPELIQMWTDFICNYFKEHPEQELFPLCPNDGLERICECPNCQKMLSPELGEWGEFSNYIWSFTDAVARRVAERCPGKKIGTFAYEKYKMPPTVPAELAPNVSVMICYKRFEFNDPAMKEKVRKLIADWSSRCKNVYFWMYAICDYMKPWQGVPICYPSIISEDMKANKALGTKGEFLESEFALESPTTSHFWRITTPALSHLNLYLSAKLLWNADADVNEIMEDYYSKFYGAGADAMKRFWTKAEKIVLAHKYIMGITTPVKYYTRDDVQEFFALLDEAQSHLSVGSREYIRISMIRQEMHPTMDNIMNASACMRYMTFGFSDTPVELTDDMANSAWKNALSYDFTAKDGSNAPFKTSMKAVADKDGMAFTIVCDEPNMQELQVKCKDNDDPDIWRDDSIELFFTETDGTGGRHFIVTAANVLWDDKWDSEEASGKSSWNSKCVHRTSRQDHGWTLQIKIPWEDLGTTYKDADKLRGNIYRNRYAGSSVQYLAFSPCPAPAHRTEDYFVNLKIK